MVLFFNSINVGSRKNTLSRIDNTFSYKNFDLSILCSGSYGNDVYVVLDQGAANLDGVFNVYKDVENRWRSPDNPGEGRYGGSYLGASTGDERDWGSDRFVDDGSYFAIKNITIGYNLPVENIEFLKSVRFYGSIQQVAIFTGYRGFWDHRCSCFHLGTGPPHDLAITVENEFAKLRWPTSWGDCLLIILAVFAWFVTVKVILWVG